MGGLVATLISHIRQNGMDYDFSALIEAVKLSATPLKNAGYVEQGYGLPKAAKAIEIYKSILAAKTFKKTTVSISPIEESSDVGKGLFLEYDDQRIPKKNT